MDLNTVQQIERADRCSDTRAPGTTLPKQPLTKAALISPLLVPSRIIRPEKPNPFSTVH